MVGYFLPFFCQEYWGFIIHKPLMNRHWISKEKHWVGLRYLFLLLVLSAIYSVIPLYLFLVNFDLLIGRLISPIANFFLSKITACSKHFLTNVSEFLVFRLNGLDCL